MGIIGGGDFSQYIIHAQNIIEQKDYTSRIMLELPVVYPPGFPLLLVPFIKIFGVNFKILKTLNVIFWYLSVLFFYPIFLKRLGKSWAVLFSLALGSSSSFFVFKQNVLSDIPFLFFVSLSIFMFRKYIDSCHALKNISKDQYLYFLSFLFFSSYAVLIRAAGITLFAAAIFYLIIVRRNYVPLLFIFLSLIILGFFQRNFSSGHIGFFSTILADPLTFMSASLKNVSLPFRSILWSFFPGDMRATSFLFLGMDMICRFISPVIAVVLFVVFLLKSWRRTISFEGCFFFFYALAIFVWAGFPHHPANFYRFLFPLLGLFLVFALQAVFFAFRHTDRMFQSRMKLILTGILSFLIIVNSANIFMAFDFDDDVILKEENQELFSWIRENISDDQHYMIWQARPVALLTKRIGTAPWQHKPKENVRLSKRIKDLDISYLIMVKGWDDKLIEVLEEKVLLLEFVWENRYYKIFKVRHSH